MSRQVEIGAMACCPPVAGRTLSEAEADVLARVFKALADPVRLRLLSMIATAEGGEACVCDLAAGFQITGPTISHHLKVLREAGLIEGDRRGTWIYYRAVPTTVEAVSAALAPPSGPVRNI
jgi:ArsR family transcriptional regulator, arsenate/arsenite/antimonite-responsive transcriptional repressor